MTNLYLPVKIAPITDDQKDGQFHVLVQNGVTKCLRWESDVDSWVDDDMVKRTYPFTHYLPDGLPDQSAAVEVFESEANEWASSQEKGWSAELPPSMLPGVTEGTPIFMYKKVLNG
jgi:hypothetical protein